MVKKSIELPDQLADWVDDQVRSGRFVDESDLFRDLIRREMGDTVPQSRFPEARSDPHSRSSYVNGDLIALALDGQFDVIVHGCNCFNTMGAGIARKIKARFPEAFAADQETEAGSKDKLGTITSATLERNGHTITVVNAYIQYHYRGRGRKVDYDALSRCFERVAQTYPKARIGYPMIGAGLAGGDWEEIAPLIDKALAGTDHTLVIYHK